MEFNWKIWWKKVGRGALIGALASIGPAVKNGAGLSDIGLTVFGAFIAAAFEGTRNYLKNRGKF